jgi:hypothetical protein
MAGRQQAKYEKESDRCLQTVQNENELDEHSPVVGRGSPIDTDRIREMGGSSLAMPSLSCIVLEKENGIVGT